VSGFTAGVKVFRVHDVRANRQAMEVAWAIAREGTETMG
jgi:dihydropteroate synthase